MARLLPRPWLSLAIALTWLALAGPSAGVLVMALLLGLLLPLVPGVGAGPPVRLARPALAPLLFARLLVDIMASALAVARVILGPAPGARSAFVAVPLDVPDPLVATILASMVSLTPGTVSVDFRVATPARRGTLLIHALDVPDEAALIAFIKGRYEAPLRALFAC
jgi:multicomponent K+:H+ antiporter subunit E